MPIFLLIWRQSKPQFHHLVRTIPGNGLVIVNGLQASLERVLARGCWSRVERFDASNGAGWQSGEADAADAFDVRFDKQLQGRVCWNLQGTHNRANALAAIAAARHAGVTSAAAIQALAEFKNVKRRMELRGEVNRVRVYDDFAHHPTAIATTIDGLRHKLGAKASAYDGLEALVGAILGAVRPGDQILVMSNGSFGGVHQKLLDGLNAKWPQ